jgi:2-polyprenyl-3-methyl-5-hydroxy-6-metoxy-1,4-benzoquinol methylase
LDRTGGCSTRQVNGAPELSATQFTALGPGRPSTVRRIDMATTPIIDAARLEEFIDRFVQDLGAGLTAPLVLLGDKLGLYKAMANGAPVTPSELAARTGCHERYIREWLCQQAASGYVDYDAATGTFRLPPEQALALADEQSPAFIVGAFQLVAAIVKDEPQISERFRSGAGFAWHQHDHDLFEGTERFFRPGYLANLVDAWLPALEGVAEKLEAGARVADIGCGHGASTILMAEAYPRSTFVGSDYHDASIEAARHAAERAGVADRVTFEVASAKEFAGGPFDLVCVFDALHDMGDPVGAARHVRSQLASDGTWMVVEPYANDAIEDNLNPVGRVFYAASTMICTPASLSQEVGAALGAQAGERQLTRVLGEGGFDRVRRAAQTPFNIVLEARP